MDVTNLATDSGESVYYDDNFLLLIYQHRNFLINNYSRVIQIDPFLAYKYDGDLSGLLDTLNFPKKYHNTIMILNNFYSITDYTKTILELIIPNIGEIDILKQLYMTRSI